MNFAWKFMLPMALVVVVSAGAWRFLPQGLVRLAGEFVISCPCLGLAGAWSGSPKQNRKTHLSLCRMMPMNPASLIFLILAIVTVAGATAAMMLRNLVHCALALAVAFTGIGTLYLSLGAQFLGLAQWLVYVGAVAVLIVFVILLTQEKAMGDQEKMGGPFKPSVGLSGLHCCLGS